MIGEHRFIGLFTSAAYSARVEDTPLLRGKVRATAAANLRKVSDNIVTKAEMYAAIRQATRSPDYANAVYG